MVYFGTHKDGDFGPHLPKRQVAFASPSGLLGLDSRGLPEAFLSHKASRARRKTQHFWIMFIAKNTHWFSISLS
jgi:hypothetical protein